MSEEDYNPYCEVCGTCGYLGCCGIRNFIEEHIKGKTNCKNENIIINELIDLCDYKDEVFKENEELKAEIEELKTDNAWWTNRFKAVERDNKELKQRIDKAIEYINKHCINEKVSKKVGYKCYTMADTNELEHIMKILGDKE